MISHSEVSQITYEVICEHDGTYSFGALGVTEDGLLALHRFSTDEAQPVESRLYEVYTISSMPWLVAGLGADEDEVLVNDRLTISPSAFIDLAVKCEFHADYQMDVGHATATMSVSFGLGLHPPAQLKIFDPRATLKGLSDSISLILQEDANHAEG